MSALHPNLPTSKWDAIEVASTKSIDFLLATTSHHRNGPTHRMEADSFGNDTVLAGCVLVRQSPIDAAGRHAHP